MSYTERVMARSFARTGYDNRDISILLGLDRDELEFFFSEDTTEQMEKEMDEVEGIWAAFWAA